MALSLKEIQEKLLAQQANKDRAKSGAGFSGDNATYPFWNNPDGTYATLRFLPDGDETNDFFWVDRMIIKLTFPGVKGQQDSKPVSVQVPCADMWKQGSCPITAEIRPWWKDDSLKDLAKKYYRKKSQIFQGFVVDNPNPTDLANAPENPIRRFAINSSVFDRIKSILMVQDIEFMPTDYDNGLDFFLVKSMKGSYANYDNSQWMRPGSMMPKPRALNEKERAAIETYKLWNLSSFLPKKPDEEHLNAIMEMFTASVNEEMYDTERWGQYYKPSGYKGNDEVVDDSDATTTTTVTKTFVPVTKKVQETTQVTSSPSATVSSLLSKISKNAVAKEETHNEVVQQTAKKAQTPDEVIAAIRARQQAK